LLTAAAAVAQQTHNQFEPGNGPGAGQKLLAQFAGDWEVVETFFPDSWEADSRLQPLPGQSRRRKLDYLPVLDLDGR
jgi:hypothetical protein